MNPFEVLGVETDADDETIRNAWLEAVRRFPPDTHPERFARTREAYERIRDRESRYRLRTFGDPQMRDSSALADLVPADRRHAGPAPWLAVTRSGPRE